MLDHWLTHSKFKESYEKLVQRLFRNKISPNHLTIIGLILGLTSAASIFLSDVFSLLFIVFYIISTILMALSFLFDTFDGVIARMREPTKFGGILDIFCDRTVEVSIIIAFVSTDPISLLYPGLFSLGGMVLCISMFLLSSIELNKSPEEEKAKIISYRKGFMERSETLIFFLLTNIIYICRSLLLWVFAILVLLTAFIHLIQTFKDLNSEKR
ncbi:MAG: CDP-alcohol phosphatidyltransferase family protein [Promethearchaeota archaeon]|nr:MAG: CDP-alcohol phosphatidyltransferase family protein [Candidatus Lokiarchaeota archaeon]